jgi:uncharacterized Tic20 family protein
MSSTAFPVWLKLILIVIPVLYLVIGIELLVAGIRDWDGRPQCVIDVIAGLLSIGISVLTMVLLIFAATK